MTNAISSLGNSMPFDAGNLQPPVQNDAQNSTSVSTVKMISTEAANDAGGGPNGLGLGGTAPTAGDDGAGASGQGGSDGGQALNQIMDMIKNALTAAMQLAGPMLGMLTSMLGKAGGAGGGAG